MDQRIGVVVVERSTSRDHLVEDHPQRIDVGALVDLLRVGDLLGRHELRRAHDERAHAAAILVGLHEPRDAEVEDLDVIARLFLVGEEDVVGLEVAVDDTGAVRSVERRGDLARDPHGAAHRHAGDSIDLVGEQRAFEVLEHDVRDALAGEPHVGRLDDVRVPEGSGGAGLVHEPLDDVGVFRELGAQHLDRDAPLDQHVLGKEHASHPALVQTADDAIPAFDGIALLYRSFHGVPITAPR